MPDTEEQLQLIDVDHPEAKVLKRLIGSYERLVNERKALKEKENEARGKVVDKVREIGKPDKTGNIRVSINGVAISIEPDEKVKIKHQGDDEEGDEDEGEESPAEEGAEPARVPRKTRG